MTFDVAAYLEDPLRAKEHLSQLWSKLNDKRLSLCLKTVTSRESSCSEVAQAAVLNNVWFINFIVLVRLIVSVVLLDHRSN